MVQTTNSDIGAPTAGGIRERRLHSGFSMEIQTDCHGDYTKCVIKLLEGRIDTLLPRFAPFGTISTYLPGLYKLDRAHYYTILFSELENAIFITLRKKARASVLAVFEEIIKTS